METQVNQETYTKENPYPAKLLKNVALTKDGSNKETRHLELSIKDSGIRYSCGDALGVWPLNDSDFIQELLALCNYNGEETVVVPEIGEVKLLDGLKSKLNLQRINPDLLKFLSEACTDEIEKALLDKMQDSANKAWFREEFLDVMDVLLELPKTKISPQQFVNSLSVLKPRLYSIASSQLMHPDEIHLTVGVNNTVFNNRLRKGVCSNYLSHAVSINETMNVYIAPSKHFHLPQEKGVDIIMVGPGTGIAPFRAFIQERIASNDSGRNWLFFGEQRKEYDYLYQDEFEAWQQSGQLAELDVAFSRDQEFKIYVQNKMEEKSSELWKWLEGGAYFYVCGDARRMAVDVDNMLHSVIEKEGKMSADDAKNYVKAMKKDKRYLRDIY